MPGGAGPAQACGCGIALESSVSDERALVVDNPGHERIVLSLDLAGDPGGRPAVVLPVPGVPEVEAIEHGDPLAYLDTATTEVEPGAVGGGAPDESAASPVDVIGRETVGGYDVARLASGEAGALDAWLRRNGYALPDGAEPILADYVDRGWRFVAIRLAAGRGGPAEAAGCLVRHRRPRVSDAARAARELRRSTSRCTRSRTAPGRSTACGRHTRARSRTCRRRPRRSSRICSRRAAR